MKNKYLISVFVVIVFAFFGCEGSKLSPEQIENMKPLTLKKRAGQYMGQVGGTLYSFYLMEVGNATISITDVDNNISISGLLQVNDELSSTKTNFTFTTIITQVSPIVQKTVEVTFNFTSKTNLDLSFTFNNKEYKATLNKIS